MPDIVITTEELSAPRIDEVILMEQALTRSDGQFVEDVRTPLYLNPIFYYTVAACLGALLVWGISEPFFDDESTNIPFLSDYLLFGPAAGMIGLALGITYGIANRNLKQAVVCAAIGLGVGMGVTVVTTVVADILYSMSNVATGLLLVASNGGETPAEGEFVLRGLPFFMHMSGRGLAWSIISMGAGLGLGIALKSRKLLLNGLAGGMVGGLLGGLLFDPISRWVVAESGNGALSRCIGLVAVSILVGFFIGLFENISKEAWFVMLQGPLAGKQFVLFKSPMVLGSAPKCDIYLFKDSAIDPKHATIEKSGARYMLTDERSSTGVTVNGNSVEKAILQHDDVLALGSTVLKYQERVKN